jgi:hypothetical protein
MKKIMFAVLVMIDINVLYSNDTVLIGNNMTFSPNEYLEMINTYRMSVFRNESFNFSEHNILEMVELNIYDKKFLVVSVDYGEHLISYDMYFVSEYDLKITGLFYLLEHMKIYLNLVHQMIMGNVPGIHLGNMPISIIDYDGDGIVEILTLSVHEEKINEMFGIIRILKYDMADDSFRDIYSPFFSINKNSTRSPIVFTRENGKLLIDYIPYEYEANR